MSFKKINYLYYREYSLTALSALVYCTKFVYCMLFQKIIHTCNVLLMRKLSHRIYKETTTKIVLVKLVIIERSYFECFRKVERKIIF